MSSVLLQETFTQYLAGLLVVLTTLGLGSVRARRRRQRRALLRADPPELLPLSEQTADSHGPDTSSEGRQKESS
jgi:hypothetical protein